MAALGKESAHFQGPLKLLALLWPTWNRWTPVFFSWAAMLAQSLRDSPVLCFCLSIYCVTGKVPLFLQALTLASCSEVLNSTGF